MSENFILSCESTVDLPFEYISARNIPILFYSYTMGDQEFEDDMGRSGDTQAFFDALDQGELPSTSQINEYRYYEFFKDLLKQGDVLHLAFGTGLTPSCNNAYKAAETLREEFPDRKIIVIDSLCGSSGYGLFVDDAADMRDSGKTMDEIAAWALDNRLNVHHQFFSTEMKFFKRSGRVSGAAATVATILNICPIMHLDDKGKIIAYTKVRGKKGAIEKTVAEVLAHAQGGEQYSGKCFVANAGCIDDAKETKAALEKAMPNIKIKITEIGNIIGCHCGRGTVAVFFWGDQRKPD